MPDGFGLVGDLARHIGQTVTIFTTSGGESGEGFTGILASVNNRFVRLILQIGSAPGCALGNCCEEERESDHFRENESDRNSDLRRRGSEFNEFSFDNREEDRNRNTERIRNTNRIRNTDRNRNRFDCSGRTLGAIVDIPVDRIAAFVHNAVGSSGW
jgi:hypothetical protein